MHPADGRVVSNFIVQALHGNPITLYGDGSQTRSFIGGLIRLMETPNTTTGPVNLGNPAEFTIRELAEIVSVEVGRPCSFVKEPLPQDDPKQRRPDITLARQHLGWER